MIEYLHKMLQKLQNLSEDSKRKLVVFLAASLTIVAAVFWGFSFFNKFDGVFTETKNKTVEIYAGFEEKMGSVYNEFVKIKEEMVLETTTNSNNGSLGTTTASSTLVASTTLNSGTSTEILIDDNKDLR